MRAAEYAVPQYSTPSYSFKRLHRPSSTRKRTCDAQSSSAVLVLTPPGDSVSVDSLAPGCQFILSNTVRTSRRSPRNHIPNRADPGE